MTVINKSFNFRHSYTQMIYVNLITPEPLWCHSGIVVQMNHQTFYYACFATTRFRILLPGGFVMCQLHRAMIELKYVAFWDERHPWTNQIHQFTQHCTGLSSRLLRASYFIMHGVSCLNPTTQWRMLSFEEHFVSSDKKYIAFRLPILSSSSPSPLDHHLNITTITITPLQQILQQPTHPTTSLSIDT